MTIRACRIAPSLILLVAVVSSCSQTVAHRIDPLSGAAARADAMLSAETIGEHDGVLASDVFEGRETGTRGERRAAGYIISILESCEAIEPDGPDGGWLQPFDVTVHLEAATANNILARLPGTDPALAQECIVLGAHYDHVGFGRSGNSLDPGNHEVHNGADDNASGSSVLLDLATSLARSGWRPRRTILFQWYSGEELGLLGSAYWVKHPTHPIGDVAFMINMDMVGRMLGRTLLVGGTGTSPGLSEMALAGCKELGLAMLDDPPGTAPSDNSSFYDAGIPCVFLFTGLHEDYHRATDDTEKLELGGMRDVGRLALRLLLAIDGADARPVFRRSPGNANEFQPFLYIGVAFADSEHPELAAVRAQVVIPGAPAERAGLREGDLVVALDGHVLASLAELEKLLHPGSGPIVPLDFTVLRPSADGASFETLHVVVQPVIR